jgi:hypothetical protein
MPDILGYVSSMAIENPHVLIPGGHPGVKSTLDKLERAKYLGDMRVRINDVGSSEKVRKTAFAAGGNSVFLHEKERIVA